MADDDPSGGPLGPGDVVWVQPEIAVGREQAGRRPALVVASTGYLDGVDSLALVVPVTSVDRGWPNHVEIVGAELASRSWAMSEQIRTISRQRVVGRAGRADPATLAGVRLWLADFLDLRP
jgi:mRNA interferase MazF